jgi:hypothetical protein
MNARFLLITAEIPGSSYIHWGMQEVTLTKRHAPVHFHPPQAGSFSLPVQQGSGAMQITLRKGITLRQGTFSAVIAPEHTVLLALNGNPELERFLFLFVCGNYSRLISHISRSSTNFEVRRPFTADQLLTVLREASHTVIFIEHDTTLFDGAERLIAPVGSALKEAGRDALVVLYSPAMDLSFAALSRQADRLIEIVNMDEPVYRQPVEYSRSYRKNAVLPAAQKTLEMT